MIGKGHSPNLARVVLIEYDPHKNSIHFNSIRVSLKNRDSLRRNRQTNTQKTRDFTSFAAVAIIVA